MTFNALEEALSLTAKLVSFPTESSVSNHDLIDFVSHYLNQHKVPFILFPNKAGDKSALFATIGPMQEGGILLSGHTDVVPVAGQIWTSDPFLLRQESTRLYGRGACDMKGFVGTVLSMVPMWKKLPLKKPLHILLSYDEETTCLGSLDVLEQIGVTLPRPRGVIVGEPTGMEVVDSHKSISTYTTRVQGYEAHSSQPDWGINAIEWASKLICELYTLSHTILRNESDVSGRFTPGFSTLSVGTIRGGTARNILARECSFNWELRGLPGILPEIILKPLDFYSQKLLLSLPSSLQDKQVSITTLTEVDVPPLMPEPQAPLVAMALKFLSKNQTYAVSFATEAGRFQMAGLPTFVCGPGHIQQAHQPDEYIEIDQIRACHSFLKHLGGSLAV